MQNKNYKNGFTLIELSMALMVTSIVLTAVATLAFALGRANDSTDDTSQKQAQVRYASLRISQLIRNSKLICSTYGDDLAIWRADDNGDGKINPAELVYLEAGEDRSHLWLLEFTSGSSIVSLSSIKNGSAKSELILSCDERRVVLVPQCSNVQFSLDTDAPKSKLVSVSFDMVQKSVTRRYQINAALACWAGHLLDENGDNIVNDDD